MVLDELGAEGYQLCHSSDLKQKAGFNLLLYPLVEPTVTQGIICNVSAWFAGGTFFEAWRALPRSVAFNETCRRSARCRHPWYPWLSRGSLKYWWVLEVKPAHSCMLLWMSPVVSTAFSRQFEILVGFGSETSPLMPAAVDDTSGMCPRCRHLRPATFCSQVEIPSVTWEQSPTSNKVKAARSCMLLCMILVECARGAVTWGYPHFARSSLKFP